MISDTTPRTHKFLYTIHIYVGLMMMTLTAVNALAQTAEDIYREANQAFHAQNYTLALQKYKQAIQKKPTYAAAYHNLGNVYYLMNEYPQALSSYARAIESDPNEAEPYASRGALYLGLGRQIEALQDFDKALEIKPQFAEAYYLRGEIYEARKDIEKACKDWRAAANMGNENAIQKIIQYCGEKEGSAFQKRRSENTLESMPDDLEALMIEGEQKMERRDYEGAIKIFNKIIQQDASVGKAYFGRGAAKFATGKQNEACEDWYLAMRYGYEQAADMLEGCDGLR